MKSQKDKSPEAQLILLAGLQDQRDDLRTRSIRAIDLADNSIKEAALKTLLNIAQNDKKTYARASAIIKLAGTGDAAYKNLMTESTKNQSYNVAVAGILGLSKYAPEEADKIKAALVLLLYFFKSFDGAVSNHSHDIATKFI